MFFSETRCSTIVTTQKAQKPQERTIVTVQQASQQKLYDLVAQQWILDTKILLFHMRFLIFSDTFSLYVCLFSLNECFSCINPASWLPESNVMCKKQMCN